MVSGSFDVSFYQRDRFHEELTSDMTRTTQQPKNQITRLSKWEKGCLGVQPIEKRHNHYYLRFMNLKI